MKNTLNKKDDSRAMSRWVEANKSRSAGISITRRPGSKGTRTISRKSRHRPFYRPDQRSLISGIFIMHRVIFRQVQTRVFRLCVYSPNMCCMFLLARVCDDGTRSTQEKSRRCRQGREGWAENGARRRNERWQKGVGPDMGESPSSLEP